MKHPRYRHFLTGAALAALLASVPTPGVAQTAGRAPDPKTCSDTANPPADTVTQGGCIAITRSKGNCQACHFVAGATSGNIAPPLVGVAQRHTDKSRLRAQIEDATRFNPRSVMPPYGRHEILTPEEIDKVVAWLLTL
jgi:sulfur-oxidizing protein SoxX